MTNVALVAAWNDHKELLQAAHDGISLPDVEAKLAVFDKDAFQEQVSNYAVSRNVTIKWVDASYSGGFDYNSNIRHENNYGIDQDIKTAKEFVLELLQNNAHETIVTGFIQRKQSIDGCCDDLCYYAFGPDVLPRAIDHPVRSWP